MEELGTIACKVPEEKLPDDAGAEELSTQQAEPCWVPRCYVQDEMGSHTGISLLIA